MNELKTILTPDWLRAEWKHEDFGKSFLRNLKLLASPHRNPLADSLLLKLNTHLSERLEISDAYA